MVDFRFYKATSADGTKQHEAAQHEAWEKLDEVNNCFSIK